MSMATKKKKKNQKTISISDTNTFKVFHCCHKEQMFIRAALPGLTRLVPARVANLRGDTPDTLKQILTN